MKKEIVIIVLISLIGIAANHVFAQTQDTEKNVTPPVTPPAQPAGDVVNAVSSNANYSTTAQLVRAANLELILKTGGPYTIFAPNNIAFANLPARRLDSLTKDTAKLAALLKGHIVTGRYAKADIIKALTAGKGKVTLSTLNGQTLTLSIGPASTLQLTNAAGNTAEVTLYDLAGTNGIINGINGILMPGR